MIPLDEIKELAQKNNYGFNHYKHPLGEPTRVVLIGERHAVHQDYTFQSRLIQLVKPKVVMHEFYEPKGTLSKSDTGRIAVDQINRWKREYGVQLKPCDLPKIKIHQFEQLVYGFLGKLRELDDE